MGTKSVACSMLYQKIPVRNNYKQSLIWGDTWFYKPTKFYKLHFQLVLAMGNVGGGENAEEERVKPRFRWVEIGPSVSTEAQKQAISQLPHKMTKRCKSIMKQLICFSPEKGFDLSALLAAWVRIMRPSRADWLAVLKELSISNHPLYLEVAELALLQESFEANVRDYTKIIDIHGRQGRLRDAEDTLQALKSKGLLLDQITLTAMLNMYSKAGELNLAEQTFEEMKLLGEPLDNRSYGSMVMAYIRAGMPARGEALLKEMDAQQIYARSEVYKALLRAYSMNGDAEGAQRVFDAIQLAGIVPDAKLCGLIINAYAMTGRSEEAYLAFQNMRRVGIEASDKCVAVMLAGFEKEDKLNQALGFLMELERDRIVVGKEAAEVLAGWFRRLGVVEEVELVLRDYAARESSVV